MIAALPPTLSHFGKSASAESRCSSSPLTAIRSAWKTRVEGSIVPHFPGMLRRTIWASWAVVTDRLNFSGLDDPPRDAAAVPFFAVFIKEIGQILGR